MAARSRSKVSVKYKTMYRVANWAEYEQALRRRGDLTVWFDEGAANSWNEQPSGLPGGQRRYSDIAILASLTLRTVFHLALRQTEGFVTSLIRLMGLELKTPDHTHDALSAQRHPGGPSPRREQDGPAPPGHRLDRLEGPRRR